MFPLEMMGMSPSNRYAILLTIDRSAFPARQREGEMGKSLENEDGVGMTVRRIVVTRYEWRSQWKKEGRKRVRAILLPGETEVRKCIEKNGQTVNKTDKITKAETKERVNEHRT
jgi:hypothetical protein